jgi:hypothetical protein
VASFQTGTVVAVTEHEADLLRVVVATDAGEIEAVGYPGMLGPIDAGNRVVVNTTGLALRLGTGGVGFVLWNLDGAGPPPSPGGHIVKMRYTPWQTEVLAAEEPEGPHHRRLREVESIDGMPVVVCGLHSQVAGVAAGIKAARPRARIGYLMSDGGALPMAISDLVRAVRAAGLVDVTCTYGHAFGGDIEAINVFSGLAALRWGEGTDVVVAAMGPGLAGSATRLGFSGLEQGQMLDAAAALGGTGVACLRVSFADSRQRHQGVSHHSLTALRVAARERCTVALPTLEAGLAAVVRAALDESGVAARHVIEETSGAPGYELLRAVGVAPVSMGRAMSEDPALQLAASAAGAVAANLTTEARGRDSEDGRCPEEASAASGRPRPDKTEG